MKSFREIILLTAIKLAVSTLDSGLWSRRLFSRVRNLRVQQGSLTALAIRLSEAAAAATISAFGTDLVYLALAVFPPDKTRSPEGNTIATSNYSMM